MRFSHVKATALPNISGMRRLTDLLSADGGNCWARSGIPAHEALCNDDQA